MTEIQRKYGPFANETPKFWPNGPAYLETCGVEDRLALVKKSTDQEWLAAVLVQAGQKTVRLAAARRLKKLTYPKAVNDQAQTRPEQPKGKYAETEHSN